MADEVFDGTDVIRQLFREGQRVTDEAGDALPHGIVETLDRMGFAGVLCDGLVWRRGNAPGVDRIWIRRAGRLLAGPRRQIGPPRLRTRVTALSDVAGHALPRLLVHREPPPVLGGLGCHDAPPRLRCHRQTPDEPLAGSRARQPRQRLRERRQAGDHTAHQPPATHADCPAEAMPGNLLAEQACHEGALGFAHAPVLRLEDTGATPRLTLMVLLPRVQRTIALASLGTTGWTCCSHDHNALLPP